MKKNLASILLAGLFFALPGSASAHSLWVNLYESFAHHPGHIMTSLGWGHQLPLDDFMDAPNGSVTIKNYDLISPDQRKSPLGLPKIGKPELKKLDSGFKLQTGDLGLRKLSLTPDVAPGTYQVAAESTPTFFTMYLNEKGRFSWKAKPMDQIKGAKKIISSMQYKSYAKAYSAVKKWTEVKPLGHDLEIMPLCDLSQVKKGGLVKVKCTYRGKPVSTKPGSMVFMIASSPAFDGGEGYTMASKLSNGEATFRLPEAGQWLLSIYYTQDVAKTPELSGLKDKCNMAIYSAALSLNIKP